ncbi:PFL-like glycyl radical enzyme [Gonapodya prolifera JEL478]|uniref:ribonucleoside-triphosphate reductase (thioredoxin) n=1 Tax=Gonapodya prolifera (strain JEL478) TaxID=1344416 RepID=A0A138ZXL1_GONPJ|nr:PFL-like glycyl radical enzyme [Gonapodya prolifera JEL478]|eukprot:KXS08873.1 PFL-like glycyl radical enzyme [Gonapodya prolifera JEL478]
MTNKPIMFTLDPIFLEKYRNIPEPFPNQLSKLVYERTYARLKQDGTHEVWWETVKRVVEGCYTYQRIHVLGNNITWDQEKAQRSAQEMYTRMFTMKFLPPGRGLWSCGTEIVNSRQLYEALNNCAFVSTDEMFKDPLAPFTFMMNQSMLGVGVGFDTEGAGSITIKKPKENTYTHVIEDTREGWVKSLELLLSSYFFGSNTVLFDYSSIRKEGTPLKTFGGIASGPQPLIDLHIKLREVLDRVVNKPISTTTIVDIQNLIGCCVVAGGVRRSSQIAIGNLDDREFGNLKNYEVNPDRMAYGWTSNNSVKVNIGDDYSKIVDAIIKNGEPGIIWLENARKYGRMTDQPNHKDMKVKGVNPCSEMGLESYELCCLLECFITNCDNMSDFLETLKSGYLYAKTVTLGKSADPNINAVQLRNRRIGVSISGVVQFIAKHNVNVLREWLKSGYEYLNQLDMLYSNWLCVPRSIKITTVKPSGTVSLLAGVTPGIHYPQSTYYIRRVRLDRNSHVINDLRKQGYHIEPEELPGSTRLVASFPMCVGEGVRTLQDVTIWEQLGLASLMQELWSDNLVSMTVTFKKEEQNSILPALSLYETKLKSVSFLPLNTTYYPQLPYETITKDQYLKMLAEIKERNQAFSGELVVGEDVRVDTVYDAFCDGDQCGLK